MVWLDDLSADDFSDAAFSDLGSTLDFSGNLTGHVLVDDPTRGPNVGSNFERSRVITRTGGPFDGLHRLAAMSIRIPFSYCNGNG